MKSTEIPSRVQTYDFENLFSNIPIDILHSVIEKIYYYFDIENELKIEGDLFLNLCHFCFNNNYITFQREIFNQIHGIGMGTNFSSTAANLFLFFYEFNYTVNYNRKIKIFRYIDDILVINFDFTLEYKKIYPNCLKLNKTNQSDFFVDFLDVSISIQNSVLELDLFDKRHSFSFTVQNLPHWSSNLHKKVFNNILTGQLIRFYKICSSYEKYDVSVFRFTANLYYNNNYPLTYIRYYCDLFRKGLWRR